MFIDLVRKRRSIRSYQQKNVDRELIEKCLQAVQLAPSACNSQPWHFIVIDQPELKQLICQKVFSGPFALMNSCVESAPVLVAVVSSSVSIPAKLGAFVRNTNFTQIDIAIATEHFILQAAELDLGSCWIGWFNERRLKKILKIPFCERVYCLFSLGYPEKQPQPRSVKKLEDIRSFNSYKNKGRLA